MDTYLFHCFDRSYSKEVPKPPPEIDFIALLNHFDQVQKRHSEYIRKSMRCFQLSNSNNHTTTCLFVILFHFLVRLDSERTLQQLYQEKKQIPLESLETSGNEMDKNTVVGSVKRVMKRQVASQSHFALHSPSSTPSLNRNEPKTDSQ